MSGDGKSDRPVVPANLPDKTGGSGGGGRGGKGTSQGKRGQQNATRTQCRASRAKCAGPRACSSTEGQGSTVHRPAAPRQPVPAPGGLPGDPPRDRAGGGQGDVGRVRAGPGG